ncbi:hypothetical protein KQX54_004471 [Cotesia glomerata]|uniref:Ig-like domain-containing protein n=1 Tax=Cotesia glomerata TaxID=32391 RepID=A0AAV7I5L0_COTGL|nr:hypothetical protein KQX54_004471 [Cotesia glomerata]
MHLKKYEWVASPDLGDCSLWVRSATLEFDDGLWQCQVTASDFTTQDALASEPARLVVRVSPQRPQIEYAGGVILPGGNVTARAGEIATLTCTARYGNPPPLIKWFNLCVIPSKARGKLYFSYTPVMNNHDLFCILYNKPLFREEQLREAYGNTCVYLRKTMQVTYFNHGS